MHSVPQSGPGAPSNLTAAPRSHPPRWTDRILIVEDDPGLRSILAEFLAEQGYHVVTAIDGADGLDKIKDEDFAIIVSDLWMPRLSGDLFYRAVERSRPELCDRFVFMSAQRETVNVVKFIDSVGRTILAKPFRVDDLLEVIAFIRVRLTIQSAA